MPEKFKNAALTIQTERRKEKNIFGVNFLSL